MKECRSAEFHIIMDHKNMPQETSEIVEKLKSKVESLQRTFDKIMNRVGIESIRGGKLKITYKMNAECNSVRLVMLDALIGIETVHPNDSDKVRLSAFVRSVQKIL
uniref:Uncharacterized protein n=1 Tax=Onchocerca volvulus TaxID=6282 RepID=A0A8R1XK78_ONCVO